MKKGYSRATFNVNLTRLVKEGYSRSQALAIAFDVARKSFYERYPKGALPEWIARPGEKRVKNPVPPSKNVQLQNAVKLFENFTGHEGKQVGVIDKPDVPGVMLVVGEMDGVLYSTVRDGKLERYIHEFAKDCRPLFCVSMTASLCICSAGRMISQNAG